MEMIVMTNKIFNARNPQVVKIYDFDFTGTQEQADELGCRISVVQLIEPRDA